MECIRTFTKEIGAYISQITTKCIQVATKKIGERLSNTTTKFFPFISRKTGGFVSQITITDRNAVGSLTQEDFDMENEKGDWSDKYVEICPAGSGSYSGVLYCLPKEVEVTKNSTNRRDQGDMSHDPLSNIVVVKVAKPAKYDIMASISEVKTLKSIQRHVKANTRTSRCVKALGYGIGYDRRWIALSTCVSAFTIEELCDSVDTFIPQELVLHVFIQTTEALQFLHESCTPMISHNDIHAGNIMLVPSKQDTPGFPNVMLIDFGSASSLSGCSQRQIAVDTCGFFQTIFKLSSKADLEQKEVVNLENGKSFKTFYKFLQRDVLEGGWGVTELAVGLRRMWGMFGNMAISRRAQVSDTTLCMIKALVQKISAKKVNRVEAAIQDLANLK